MKRRLAQLSFILFAFLAIACAATAVFFRFYGGRLEITDAFVFGTTSVLLVFLALLMLRCLMLTGISFAGHGGTPPSPGKRGRSEHPSFSVVIPAYNEGTMIEASIEGAMSLAYPNYEVIVVDDGSTDDTYEKAVALSSRYGAHRLRVFRKAGGERGAALNAGIHYSRGELIRYRCRFPAGPRRAAQSVRTLCRPLVSAVAGNVELGQSREYAHPPFRRSNI